MVRLGHMGKRIVVFNTGGTARQDFISVATYPIEYMAYMSNKRHLTL